MQKLFFLLCGMILLSSCAVYKIDVRQGNLVTQEMLDQIEYGMPARKVRFVLGTPLIKDVFHANRWDYLYSFKSGRQQAEQRLITLIFDESDNLTRIEGDVVIGQGNRDAVKPTLPDSFDNEPIL